MRPLGNGDHVIIIGGGPAGTACALALLRMAAADGKRIEVTIVEGKEFSGERHYNQCLGVLSPPLSSLMETELDLPFPAHLSRGEIWEYMIHGRNEVLVVGDRAQPSVALRRVHFDAYMLEAAKARGARVILARAMDLEILSERVVVYTDSQPVHGSVVVGAFGLDEGSASIFERHTSYRRPKALDTIVTKYHPGQRGMDRFGARIHAFLPSQPQIEFGAVTPKGNHLSIVIAGREVDSHLMSRFLDFPVVRSELPDLESAGSEDPNDLRYFKGRFPCSLARDYYGDRYVLVGDAAGLVRAFKGKGVTSAVQTGIRAAEAMLRCGISRSAFQAYYAKANREIIQDMPYGRLMRLVAIGLARMGLLDSVLRAARSEPRLNGALYNAVSGHAPYRRVLADSLSVGTGLAILRGLRRARKNDAIR